MSARLSEWLPSFLLCSMLEAALLTCFILSFLLSTRDEAVCEKAKACYSSLLECVSCCERMQLRGVSLGLAAVKRKALMEGQTRLVSCRGDLLSFLKF